MAEKPGKLQPALIGGLILGLLSSIPIIDIANLCCCLWVLVGGALAARMLVRRSPLIPVSYGDGALVGALAGVVGSAIILVIGVPLNLLLTSPRENIETLRQLPLPVDNPSVRQVIDLMQNQPVLFALLSWMIQAVITVAFATLGGMIGVALFEKRRGQPNPPPPVGFMPPPSDQQYPPPPAPEQPPQP